MGGPFLASIIVWRGIQIWSICQDLFPFSKHFNTSIDMQTFQHLVNSNIYTSKISKKIIYLDCPNVPTPKLASICTLGLSKRFDLYPDISTPVSSNHMDTLIIQTFWHLDYPNISTPRLLKHFKTRKNIQIFQRLDYPAIYTYGLSTHFYVSKHFYTYIIQNFVTR